MLRILFLSGVVVLLTALAVAQEKDEKAKKPTVEQVKAKYEGEIKKLDGVADVGLAHRGDEELLVIEVISEKARELLDNLLSDELEGYKIIFDVTGKPLEGQEPDEAKEKHGEIPLCFK